MFSLIMTMICILVGIVVFLVGCVVVDMLGDVYNWLLDVTSKGIVRVSRYFD